MKNSIKFLVFVCTVFLGMNTSTAQSPNTDTTQVTQTVQYTCSMHPEILFELPGKCPKCGMQLIEKSKVSEAKNMGMMHPGMMGGMNNSSHKRKFPLVLIMGVMMAIMMVVVVAKK
jgi:hypothetical protein